MESTATAPNELSKKSLTSIIYGLYASSFILGVTVFIAIIMNYVKKSEVVGTYLESHFRWQIRTFWFSLLWFFVGLLLILFSLTGIPLLIIGIPLLIGNAIWMIYRIVRGWLTLNDNKPMYAK